MESQPLRVLVVDDSALYRKIVRELLAALPDVDVVGTAPDGEIALRKIEELRPDLVTLDVAMPRLDGLGVLRRLRESPRSPVVLVLSALSGAAADVATQALRLGALDLVVKPAADSFEHAANELRRQLVAKIGLARAHRSENPHRRAPASASAPVVAEQREAPSRPVEVVGIGVSTGGPAALANLLPRLPADLPIALLIVQHMPPLFTQSLADDLNRQSSIDVREARDGEPLCPGVAYIAPGGRQMKVEQQTTNVCVRITDDPPERSCKPSVDYLFRSLAHVHGAGAMGVILTGMGDDGVLGARLLKRQGAQIIAQDQRTCVVYGMPRGAVEAGIVDRILPLEAIAPAIVAAVSGTASCR